MAEKTSSTQTLAPAPYVDPGTDAPPAPAPAAWPAPLAGAPAAYPGGEAYEPGISPRTQPRLADRFRTPIAGAILGGVVLLGAGFGAGYLVGKDNGSSVSTSTVDPAGQQGGFGGPAGQGGFGGMVPPGQQGSQGGLQQGTQGGLQQGTQDPAQQGQSGAGGSGTTTT